MVGIDGVTPAREQASGNVLVSLGTTAPADRAFLVVQAHTMRFDEETLEEAAPRDAWLEQTDVKRGERALAHVRKSPLAVIRDLPSTSLFMGTSTFHPRLLAEEIS